VGTRRYKLRAGVKFRAQIPFNNFYVQRRARGLIAPLRALDRFYSPFPTISETTAVWAVRLAAVTEGTASPREDDLL
jgi:hypothetical protein